jgi:pyrimidine oxygenase
VAEKLNELAEVEGTSGLMLTFDDFLAGVEAFGQEVMPLLS